MNRGGRKSAMDRWEDQQRLKRMSKKITEAQSILKKEKKIGVVPLGQRRNPTPSGDPDSGRWEHAGLGNAPYHPSDVYPVALSKKQQPKKQRPEWNDGHKVYNEADKPRKREREKERGQRPRPAPVQVQVKKTPSGVRGALVKNIMHVEKIVAKALKSPKKGMRKMASDLQEIQALRKSLCRGNDAADAAKCEWQGHPAADGATEGVLTLNTSSTAGMDMKELRQSICQLSRILDNKLDLMMNHEVMDETECEVNLASPNRNQAQSRGHLMEEEECDGVLLEDDDAEVECGVEEGIYDNEEDGFEEEDDENEGAEEGYPRDFEAADPGGSSVRDSPDDSHVAYDTHDGDGDGDAAVAELAEAAAKVSLLEIMVTGQEHPGADSSLRQRPPSKGPSKVCSSAVSQLADPSVVAQQGQQAGDGGNGAAVNTGGDEQPASTGEGDGGAHKVVGSNEGVVVGVGKMGGAEERSVVRNGGVGEISGVVAPVPRASKPFSFKLKTSASAASSSSSYSKDTQANKVTPVAMQAPPLFTSGLQRLNSQASLKPFALLSSNSASNAAAASATIHGQGREITDPSSGESTATRPAIAAPVGSPHSQVSACACLQPGGDAAVDAAASTHCLSRNEDSQGGSAIALDADSSTETRMTTTGSTVTTGGQSGLGGLHSSHATSEQSATARPPGDAYHPVLDLTARPKRGTRGMLSLFMGTNNQGNDGRAAVPAYSFEPRGATSAADPSQALAQGPKTTQIGQHIDSSPASEQGAGARRVDSPVAAAAGEATASVALEELAGGEYNRGEAVVSPGSSSAASDERGAGAMSRAETERRMGQSPDVGGEVGGRRRINAADIKRAMMAAEAAYKPKHLDGDNQDGGNAGVGPRQVEEPCYQPIARPGRGPFKPMAPPRFSAALSFQPSSAVQDDSNDDEECGDRGESSAAIDVSKRTCPAWAESMCGADIESSLDVIDAL